MVVFLSNCRNVLTEDVIFCTCGVNSNFVIFSSSKNCFCDISYEWGLGIPLTQVGKVVAFLPLFFPEGLPKSRCLDEKRINSWFIYTRLKDLTPALLVLLVTNMRYDGGQRNNISLVSSLWLFRPSKDNSCMVTISEARLFLGLELIDGAVGANARTATSGQGSWWWG